MEPLPVGSRAPAVPGAAFGDDASALLFYKVTCPTCAVAAPAAERFHEAFADRFVAVAQDPPEAVEEFARSHGNTFRSISDAPPYAISDAYGIRTVPTLFLLEGGRTADIVESWDREGWNRVAAGLAERSGMPPIAVSADGDGLPPFKPG